MIVRALKYMGKSLPWFFLFCLFLFFFFQVTGTFQLVFVLTNGVRYRVALSFPRLVNISDLSTSFSYHFYTKIRRFFSLLQLQSCGGIRKRKLGFMFPVQEHGPCALLNRNDRKEKEKNTNSVVSENRSRSELLCGVAFGLVMPCSSCWYLLVLHISNIIGRWHDCE